MTLNCRLYRRRAYWINRSVAGCSQHRDKGPSIMLHVACDVCRRRYQVDDSRLGTELTCKECSVPFDVCRENFVDPHQPEPEPHADDPEHDPPASEWREVWACVINGVGALGIIVSLAAMLMLLFQDPREVVGPTVAAASTTGAQGRRTARPATPSAPRRENRSDDTAPTDRSLSAAPGAVSDIQASSIPPDPDTAAVPGAETLPPVDAEPPLPLNPLTISAIDPPRVQPGRTFRVLGTGMSGVERVALVPTDLPVLAVRSLAQFEVVSDDELRVQITDRPATYVLVLERTDLTLVTVPADAHIVTSDEQSPPAESPGFVVVRDGGRFEANGVVCCLVERGGELNCHRSANWAGWLAEGSVATGLILPPAVWTTPETDVRVSVPDRARLAVTTPAIMATEVPALVTADPSAAETPVFDGPPSGMRLTARAQRSPGSTDGKVNGINYDGPGAIPSSGRRIDPNTPLEVGQIVQVRDRAWWYAADVLRVNDDGTVRIHYRGWSDTADKDVPRSRIQLAHED
jgi:hypothetical protein